MPDQVIILKKKKKKKKHVRRAFPMTTSFFLTRAVHVRQSVRASSVWIRWNRHFRRCYSGCKKRKTKRARHSSEFGDIILKRNCTKRLKLFATVKPPYNVPLHDITLCLERGIH